jgi:lipoprotein-anchoring transpeptidase ErfK/SrfK
MDIRLAAAVAGSAFGILVSRARLPATRRGPPSPTPAPNGDGPMISSIKTLTMTLVAAALASTAAGDAKADPFGALFGGMFGQPRPQYSVSRYSDPAVAPAYAYGPEAGQTAGARIPREIVEYNGPYAPGTVVISTSERRLYLILPGRQALKYGIGVGREGFEWAGTQTISRKQEWPSWTPPAQMLRRRPDLPHYMDGGPENPLGARAMYLGGSLYRIHGSNEPDTIGTAVSSGCIRMLNEDVVDLYDRVRIGTRVVVLR